MGALLTKYVAKGFVLTKNIAGTEMGKDQRNRPLNIKPYKLYVL